MTDTIHFVRCWVDGGVLGHNPSPRGVYWSVRVENLGDGIPPVMIRKRSKGYSTNNQAEYLALREVLLWLIDRKIRMPVVIYSDSKLIVNQFNGVFACNVPTLIAMRDECRELAGKLQKVIVKLAGQYIARDGSIRQGQPRAVMVRKLGH